MSDRTEQGKAAESTKSARCVYARVSELGQLTNEALPSLANWHPQIHDVAFPLTDTTETKTWTFGEWYIPPLGSGRTIIDLWPQPKLILVRTTTVGGAKTLYIAIETNIRVWNPFVAGHEAVLSATILDVGQNFVFGTFPSGCGVSTWIARNVVVRDDIFDKANTAQLNMSGYSFFYC